MESQHVDVDRGQEYRNMTDKHYSTKFAGDRLRHARMRIETAVLMSRGNESFPTELEDISATGVLLRRPRDWSGSEGQTWVLDMVFRHDLHIHLEASVARVYDQWLGMAYSRIPEDKQAALWDLLGGYADTLESWER
ncbi:MAG TPA: PilZ domain-containing protein [Oleiagrimonas sp.]|nr:PilZ domain-containing protein [Oleiagrimonas sp.]